MRDDNVYGITRDDNDYDRLPIVNATEANDRHRRLYSNFKVYFNDNVFTMLLNVI